MSWWRQMKSPNPRLKIMDIEDPRIVVAIPADNIERMVIKNELSQTIFFLDYKRKLALLVVRRQRLRTSNVSLGIRRTFQQLPVLVPVALWCANIARTFNHQKAIRAFAEVITMK